MKIENCTLDRRKIVRFTVWEVRELSIWNMDVVSLEIDETDIAQTAGDAAPAKAKSPPSKGTMRPSLLHRSSVHGRIRNSTPALLPTVLWANKCCAIDKTPNGTGDTLRKGTLKRERERFGNFMPLLAECRDRLPVAPLGSHETSGLFLYQQLHAIAMDLLLACGLVLAHKWITNGRYSTVLASRAATTLGFMSFPRLSSAMPRATGSDTRPAGWPTPCQRVQLRSASTNLDLSLAEGTSFVIHSGNGAPVASA